MQFELPPPIQTLREAVRGFADAQVRPRVDEMEREERIPQELVEQMGELGFFGAPFPAKWGGAEVGELGFVVVQEELSRAHTATGLLVAASSGLAARLIAGFGSDEQRQRYLRPLARGDVVGSFCLTEPTGGSDVSAIRTQAVADGDEFVLQGEKAFVTNGDRAGTFLVFAKTDPERGREGISLFIVERNAPGLELLRLEDKMGLRASATAHISLSGVRVPRANLVGELNEGFAMALSTLNWSRIGIGAMCLGVAKEALDLGWSYAHSRQMFGTTVAGHQVTQHAFADMQTDVFASESMIYRTAAMAEAGIPFEAEASMCKVFASEAAQRVVDRALQMHGGAGYLRDFPIERLYRDIRVARVYEGPNEVQRNNVYRVMRNSRH